MKREPSWLEITEVSRGTKIVDNARALSAELALLRGSELTTEFTLWPSDAHATGNFPGIRQKCTSSKGWNGNRVRNKALR